MVGFRARLSVALRSARPEQPTAAGSAASGHGHGHGGGHGHGHGGPPARDPNAPYSFVQDDMRAYAMKLHTRDQAPREGQQPAEKPFTAWQPGRVEYLHFLVDSLLVYETMDKIVAKYPALAPFRQTGLERTDALREDLKWLVSFDPTLSVPSVGPSGLQYAAFLEALAAESLPKFMCHYYNHYFAHTAGGRMIGKKMADTLLGGTTLKFYQWEGDVRALLDATRVKMDAMAAGWSAEEKLACLEETAACFRFGGGLMVYMKDPAASAKVGGAGAQ